MILDVWSLLKITFLTSSTEPPMALRDDVKTAMKHFEKRMGFFWAVNLLETYLKRNEELKYQPDFSILGTSPAQANQGYYRLLQLNHDIATLDDLTEDERNACESIAGVWHKGMGNTEVNQKGRLMKEKFLPRIRQEIHNLIATIEKMEFRHKLTEFQYANPSTDPKYDWVRILIEFADPM